VQLLYHFLKTSHELDSSAVRQQFPVEVYEGKFNCSCFKVLLAFYLCNHALDGSDIGCLFLELLHDIVNRYLFPQHHFVEQAGETGTDEKPTFRE
jgi:hypothetical protein